MKLLKKLVTSIFFGIGLVFATIEMLWEKLER